MMFLGFLVSFGVMLLLYGTVCRAIYRKFQSNPTLRERGGLLMLAVSVAWFPVAVVHLALCSLFPIVWGHAGELLILGALASGFFCWMTTFVVFNRTEPPDPPMDGQNRP